MVPRMSVLITVAGLISVVVATLAAQTTPDYVKQVEAWRARHEADYRRDYVPLAGLFYLDPGPNSAGSAPGSRVALPGRLPASIGRFVLEKERVTFEPVDRSPAKIAGKAVTVPVVLRPDGEPQPPEEIQIDDVSLWVHKDGDKRTIRMRDPQGEPARTFKGFAWFPIDPKYRVVGRFIRDPKPSDVMIPSLSGEDQQYTTEGLVEITLGGQTVRMRPMTTRPNRFFFIFRDASAGKETYEAARFLYTDLAPDGTTVLDFNEAYNPPCAFNPFTTCPLPPRENRLTMPILAGERNYAK
jgi:uncharacterized protein